MVEGTQSRTLVSPMKLKDKIQQVLGTRRILLENRLDSETSSTRESSADVDVDDETSKFPHFCFTRHGLKKIRLGLSMTE